MISLVEVQHSGTFYYLIHINNYTGIPLHIMRSSQQKEQLHSLVYPDTLD